MPPTTDRPRRRLDASERRARLARRQRLAPACRAARVEQAAEAVVALHGTDPATVYLSARARTSGMEVADLERALYADRTLVKHLAMRRTLFVFPRALLADAQAGASERVAARERKRLIRDVERAGLHADGERWLARVSASVLEALGDGRELTAAELRAEVPLLEGSILAGTGKWGGSFPVAPRALTTLSAGGHIVRASNVGGWTGSRPRWTAMAAWLGAPLERRDPEEGLARLVSAWLHAFGPGTEADLRWWLGGTLTGVRRALATLGAVEVELDGRTGYLLPDDLEPVEPVEPWAALLPALDPTTMGWLERDWYLGRHRPLLFDSNGNAGPTAWWDGRIVGGWHQDEAGEVALDLLDDVGAEAVAMLEAEAAALEAWLGGTRVRPRFLSPLQRSLV